MDVPFTVLAPLLTWLDSTLEWCDDMCITSLSYSTQTGGKTQHIDKQNSLYAGKQSHSSPGCLTERVPCVDLPSARDTYFQNRDNPVDVSTCLVISYNLISPGMSSPLHPQPMLKWKIVLKLPENHTQHLWTEMARKITYKTDTCPEIIITVVCSTIIAPAWH